ncbi:MAG: DUF1365 domain-containing protein [Planctomycetaceae bacterium]|nr:MAG: DUF1365 domain-containing protein [Planctomycetaceae bacterium]
MNWRSALYTGWVRHERREGVRHLFRQRMTLFYLDLDELSQLPQLPGIFSTRSPAWISWRARDYLLGQGDLRQTARQLVAQHLGFTPQGPIRLLTHPRYVGWLMNPVSFYYCFDAFEQLQVVIAEVNNTPWNERHHYVLRLCSTAQVPGDDRLSCQEPRAVPEPSGEYQADLPAPARSQVVRGSASPLGRRVFRSVQAKQFHVSPFFSLNYCYRFALTPPGDRLRMTITMSPPADPARWAFRADLVLQRIPWSRWALARQVLRQPFMSLQVSARIYYEAWKLWRRGARYYPHPGRGPRAETPQAQAVISGSTSDLPSGSLRP